MKRIILSFFFLWLLVPPSVFARVGVGIGTGKIEVQGTLKPGMIYSLPPLTVLNTGDEAADYEVSLSYHQDQPQLAPPKEWFSFSPATFRLEPGKVQVVNVRLNLPLKVSPGEYFAYLEGYPVKKNDPGNTTIGIAAAAKLYFTVAPANLVLGIYYRALSFWKLYHRILTIVAAILVIAAAIIFFRRFFHIQINLKRNQGGTNE
ncbi:MAG TPA: hypothetical protein VMW04_03700 [Patescibacteria group bacterium]|nr:hypothetical protein [Patescibacteria group bacterium]